MLRQSIAFQACENWPMSITCFDEANRIKSERESEIEDGVSIELSPVLK